MAVGDALICLLEESPEATATKLYASVGDLAADDVFAVATVVDRIAFDDVGPRTTVGHIPDREQTVVVGDHDVVAAAAGYLVGASATEANVVAVLAEHQVIAVAAVRTVVSVAETDQVVAAQSEDEVVAALGHDDIVAWCPDQEVWSVGTDDGCGHEGAAFNHRSGRLGSGWRRRCRGWLAELAIFEAVDAHEAADRARLDAARARLADVADGARPIRQWHARLLEGVYAADVDDAEAAVEHREAAFQHAVGHGIRHAVSVRLAARFAEELLAGRPLTAAEDLKPERYPGLDSNPPMLEAGVALMLEYHGETNRALAAAEGVAELSLARVNRRSAPCLTLVAPILARSKRDRLVMKASELLLARGDVMVLASMFIAGLGPSPLAAAHLARCPSDRKELLQRAGRIAEQSGSARWHRHLLSL